MGRERRGLLGEEREDGLLREKDLAGFSGGEREKGFVGRGERGRFVERERLGL